MAVKHNTPFSLVFLAAATLLVSGHASAARVLAGADVCAAMDNPTLCKEVVKGATDTKVAVENAIKLLLSETKAARDVFAKLEISDSIDVCNENYQFSIDSLERCLAILNGTSKDGGDLNVSLSAALNGYVTCDDAFAESNAQSPIAKTSARLKDIDSICLQFSNIVKY